MSGLSVLELVITLRFPDSVYSLMRKLISQNIWMIQRKSLAYFDEDFFRILHNQMVSSGSDLFPAARIFLVIFFSFFFLFVLFFPLSLWQESIFSFSALYSPGNTAETFPFQSKNQDVCMCENACVCVGLCVCCVRTSVFEFGCVSGGWTPWRDSSLKSSAQMFCDISLCFLHQSQTVVSHTLFKGTQMNAFSRRGSEWCE